MMERRVGKASQAHGIASICLEPLPANLDFRAQQPIHVRLGDPRDAAADQPLYTHGTQWAASHGHLAFFGACATIGRGDDVRAASGRRWAASRREPGGALVWFRRLTSV